jgi:acyl carrier protein
MYGLSPADLKDDTSFLESGILDSTGVMELIVFLENEFSIAIHDSEILPENLDSLNNICRFLSTKASVKETSSGG